MIERLSYDLEKVFAICFTDQCLARLKQTSLFPLRTLLIWAVNSSIAQSHYCISNDVKVKCRSFSRKFHGDMTLFASVFAISQRKFSPVCSCSISQSNVLHFWLSSVFTYIFQGYVKVALPVIPLGDVLLIREAKQLTMLDSAALVITNLLSNKRAGMEQWSHLCGPGSTPIFGVVCGLSLLVLYSAPRGFYTKIWFYQRS